MTNYYEILGIAKTATDDEIKTAYHKKAILHHPDRSGGDEESVKLFKQVQEAYDILSDPTKKMHYDATGTTSSGSFHSSHTHGFSGWDFFGDAPPTSPNERGRNIYLNTELELNEVLTGIKKQIKVPKKERCVKCEGAGYKDFKACPSCSGSGKVAMRVPGFNIYGACGACKATGRAGTNSCEECSGEGCITKESVDIEIQIPAGIETGNQIRIRGAGEPSKNIFGKNGDLMITIIVKDHKIFTRDSANLFLDLPVGYAELVLGTQIEIPLLTGRYLLNIPPRTTDLTQLRIKGMGVPYIHGGKGDLIVIVKLMIPPKDKLEGLRSLLESVQELENEYLTKERDKFKGD